MKSISLKEESMQRAKKILNRIIFPATAIVIISVPVAAILLIYAFLFDNNDSPIAYFAYCFSAYALTIVTAQIIKHSKDIKNGIKTALHKNSLIHRYLSDVTFKTQVSLYVSFGINMLYVVMNFASGIFYNSVWFITLAVYYSLLAVMRFLLLRHVHRNAFGKEQISQLKRYRLYGIILMAVNVALAGVVILVVKKNKGFTYSGYLIYIMAMYAFYTIISAVINVIRYRRYNSPVMSAAKVISLAAALVSMLSLETAMLAQFDNGTNPEIFRQIMTCATGISVCLIVFGLGVFMIIKSTRLLNRLKKRDR